MFKHNENTFRAISGDGDDLITDMHAGYRVRNEMKKQFKKELMALFQKFGYLTGEKDHEITFKTTSGNIAWINIKSIDVIK